MDNTSKGPVYVRKTRPKDLQEFWSIIEEQGVDKVFPYSAPTSMEGFVNLFSIRSFASVTCVDGMEVVGGGWLERGGYDHSANIVIFKRKGYANPYLIRRICREVLPSLFIDYSLEDITGMVMESSKGVIKLMEAVGFHVLYSRRDGVLIIGIGREEVLGNG